jgi:hypothetical protein
VKQVVEQWLHERRSWLPRLPRSIHCTRLALDLSASRIPSSRTSAPEQVLAAELQDRGQTSDALSMMVSSMVRMVQAGKSSDSRWKAS